jgi:hypothetical protein
VWHNSRIVPHESTNKFGIQSGDAVAVIDAPPAALEHILALAPSASLRLEGRFDVLILFLQSREQLEASFVAAQLSMRKDARLWLMYPDNFLHPETDLGRERGWTSLIRSGFTTAEYIDYGDWHGIRWAEPQRKFGRG